MWEWTNWLPSIRFRTIRALSGGFTWKESSSDRVLVCPWETGQTPQILCVTNHASRGSLPFRMISNPRKSVPELQASLTFPFSTSTSIRRCPSMRGIGSMTTRLAMGSPSRVMWVGLRVPFLLLLRPHRLAHRVSGDGRARGDGDPDPDLVGGEIPVRQGHVGQLPVIGGKLVEPLDLRAPDAQAADLDAPRLLRIPARLGALRPRLRPLAPDRVEAVAQRLLLRPEHLHEMPGVEVRAARAVVVDLPAEEHLRPAVPVEVGSLAGGQEIDDRADHPLGIDGTAREVDDLPLHVERLVDPQDPARIGRRRGHPAVHGAGPDGDDGLCVTADLPGDVEHLATADHPVAGDRRDAALHDADVILALDRRGEHLFGLLPRRRHDRLVVIDA